MAYEEIIEHLLVTVQFGIKQIKDPSCTLLITESYWISS